MYSFFIDQTYWKALFGYEIGHQKAKHCYFFLPLYLISLSFHAELSLINEEPVYTFYVNLMWRKAAHSRKIIKLRWKLIERRLVENEKEKFRQIYFESALFRSWFKIRRTNCVFVHLQKGIKALLKNKVYPFFTA